MPGSEDQANDALTVQRLCYAHTQSIATLIEATRASQADREHIWIKQDAILEKLHEVVITTEKNLPKICAIADDLRGIKIDVAVLKSQQSMASGSSNTVMAILGGVGMLLAGAIGGIVQHFLLSPTSMPPGH